MPERPALQIYPIPPDLRFEFGLGLLAKVMPEQHVLGGNGGIGFKLVKPVAIGMLVGE